jgi:hypothetical protein
MVMQLRMMMQLRMAIKARMMMELVSAMIQYAKMLSVHREGHLN